MPLSRRSLAYNDVPHVTRGFGDKMAATQLQRLAYLQEMGIDTYFPIRPLPGAKPSPQYAAPLLRPQQGLPREESHAAPVTPDALQLLAALDSVAPVKMPPPQSQEAASSVIPALIQAQDLVRETVAPAATRVSSPAPLPQSTEEAAEELRFAFAFIPINAQVAVINELPWTRSVTLPSSCRQLLTDILKALGLAVEERHLSPMIFTWPLFEGADMGSEKARQTLEGFMTRRLGLQPVKHLLVFAEQSAQFLFPPAYLQEQESPFQHPRFETDVYVVHSLHAMEAVPALKRPVWQVLQGLKGRLQPASAE